MATVAVAVTVLAAPTQGAAVPHDSKPKPGKYNGKAMALEASVPGAPWKSSPIALPPTAPQLVLKAKDFPSPARAQVTLPKTRTDLARDLRSQLVRATGTPVLIGPATMSATPSAGAATVHDGGGTTAATVASPDAVSVSVSDHSSATAAGTAGVLVSLARADGQSSAASVDVAVDYSSFYQAFGGDMSDRMRLVELPTCALTTPQVAACRVQTPITYTNDPTTKQLVATVTLPAAASGAEPNPPASFSTSAQPSQAPVTPAPTSTATRPDAAANAAAANGKPKPSPTQSVTSSSPSPTQSPSAPSGSTPSPSSGQSAMPTMVLAATTAPSGATGNYTATSLSASNQWGEGANNGSFTYSYPITLPASLAGSAPSVDLGYDSGSVDGKTAVENSQPSWIGEGWDYSPGFIERSYVPCAKAQPTTYPTSGDSCFARDSHGNLLPAISLSFGSHGGVLVPTDSTNTSFRLPTDDGTQVDVLQGELGNGTRTGEFYRVRSPDGAVAFFGAETLPDVSAMTAAAGSTVAVTTGVGTGSTLREPVFNDSVASGCQDPTKVTDPAASGTNCQQGYRWNLAFVADPHSNVTRFSYTSEQNWYGRGTSLKPTAYTRGAVLNKIDYGWQWSDIVAGGQHQPASRVIFNTVNRCVDPAIDEGYDSASSSGGGYGVGTSGCANAALASVPSAQLVDTPYDQNCPSGGVTNGQCPTTSPTFWSTRRLAGITTQVAVNGSYQNVDHWDLFDQFHNSSSAMWLAAIRRCAASVVKTNGACPPAQNGVAGQSSMPDVQFGAKSMNQRVPGVTGTNVPPNLPLYQRDRLATIFDELGATTTVGYDDPTVNPQSGKSNYDPLGCIAPPTVAPDWHNTKLCYPEYWTGDGYSQPFTDWFQKYVVTSIQATDNTWQANAWNGGAHNTTTSFTYGSGTSTIYNTAASNGAGVAWHSNDSELVTDPASRTYDQYRGFAVVTTTIGDNTEAGHPTSQNTTTYLRGMDQDPDKAAATAGTCVQGTTITPAADCTPFAFTDDISGVSTVDDNALAGTAIETQTVDTVTGQVITSSTVPWKSSPVAEHQRFPTTLPYLRSRQLGAARTFTRATLSTGAPQVTETQYWHDKLQDGRVVATRVLAPTVADGTSEVCTSIAYAQPDSSRPWMTAYAASSTTTAAPCPYTQPVYGDPLPGPGPTGSVLSATRTFYDNGASWPTVVSKGDVTRTEVETGTSAAPGPFQMSNTASFDVYGRQLWATDAAGTKTTTTYTPASASTPSMEVPTDITVTGPDPTTGAQTWISRTHLDPTRGLPLTATDVNGRVTSITYDALGRTTAVWQPGRTTSTAYPPPSTVKPNTKFAYTVNGHVSGSNSGAAPSIVESDALREDGTYAVSTALLDSFGRTRQTQTVPTSDDAGRIVTDTTYDSSGRSDFVSGPYYDSTSSPSGNYWVVQAQSAIPRQTQTDYDGLGRPTDQISIASANELWRSHTDYVGADRVDVTPPSGGMRTSTVTNSHGQTTALYTYHAGVPFGTFDPLNADALTYGYDAAGNQTQVNQVISTTTSNTWTAAYNLLGQRITSQDPDAGTSTYKYDVNGNLQKANTAFGTADAKTLNYVYDLLNRRTAEYSGDTPTGTPLAQWLYDTAPALTAAQSVANPGSDTKANLGRAAGTIRNTNAANQYKESVGGYDATGHPLSASVTIPTDGTNGALAGKYTTTSHYTALGQLTSTDLPIGGDLRPDTVGYGYNANGLMVGSSDSYADLVSDSSYTQYGEIMRRVVGDYPNQVVQDTGYDVPTRRVFSSSLSQLAWNAPIDTTAYTYNAAGDVTAAVDIQGAAAGSVNGIVSASLAIDAQCYHYDYASRLDAAWSDTVPGNSPAQISTTVTNTVFGTTTAPGVGGQSDVTQIPESAKPKTGALGGCVRTAPTENVNNATWQIGGPQPYGQVFTYDPATGNRKSEKDYSASGTITTNDAYTYNTNQPHTLSSVSHSGGTSNLYYYDATGNTKQRTISGQAGTQTLTWDAENRLQSDSDSADGIAAEYVYDADGNQLIRRDQTTITLYLGSTELHMARTGSQTVTGTRYFSVSGGPTIVETGTSTPTLSYEAGNPQGTASTTIAASPTQASQAITARRAYTPFNNPRGNGQPSVFGTFPDDHTFLGKTTDASTGLADVGARKYDPSIGRFISIDPVFTLTDPQGIGGYSYSGNDPVNGSDPSGLIRTVNNDPTASYAPLYRDPCNPSACPDRHSGDGCGSLCVIAGAGHWVAKQADSVFQATPINQAISAGATSFADKTIVSGGANAPSGQVATKPISMVDSYDTWMSVHGIATKRQMGVVSKVIDVVTIVTPLGKEEGADIAENSLVNSAEKISTKCHSFEGDTRILMADGATKPIEDVKVGDEIENAQPDGGEERHKVDQVHKTLTDTDFTDLTVRTSSGSHVITGTQNHPYYDVTEHRFVNASELKPGDRLQTAGSDTVTVLSVRNYTSSMVTYDLTIDGLHTYYVVAGDTPVLVHNCDDPVKLYRSPGLGNKDSESSGLNAANHEGDHPTAYLSNKPEGAADYAGNGHDDGFHVYTMKPGFRERFGQYEFPLENTNGLPEGTTEWRISSDDFDEFNSYIDHDQTEWWPAARGWFQEP
ncbi:RHS repeat-associated core domain-containing protein [Catenulispora yoronensis]|uniref:RHS repeat-associated core domain-containing protein n=1 Tax=Catenulispora yoronensis TaxID=450799 RepID=A0ABN2U7U9_9ACTN